MTVSSEPATPPPTLPDPNALIYRPPVDGGVTLTVFCSILIPLTLIAIVTRFWARALLRKSLELNDYLVAAGAVLAIGNAVTSILAVVYGGVGRQQLTVMDQYPALSKMTLALAIIWTVANTCVKLSIVHLYLVIFRNQRIFRYCVYFVVFLTCGYCITNIVQNLLTCKPVAFNWDKSIPNGKCDSSQAPFLASACINLGIDLIIFALPIPMLSGLQMNLKKKVNLIIIFSLGFLICIISAIRIHSIAKLDFMNFSHSVVADGIYSALEPCLGVVNACLPVLQPVSNKISTSRLFSTLKGSSNKSTGFSNGTESKPATIGSGPKAKFRRMDEETGTSTDDEYPLTDVSGYATQK